MTACSIHHAGSIACNADVICLIARNTVVAISRIHRRVPGRNTGNKARARSANVGLLAAVQLHEVGVVAAFWFCDVAVLTVIQLREAEVASGEQLAQVWHPAHARERDSYGGGEDRAAERARAEDVPSIIMTTAANGPPRRQMGSGLLTNRGSR
jgi:hypothetical protein